MQDTIFKAFKVNGGHEPPNNGQFSQERFAFLFKPGEYDVEVPVGYYTTVHGLGALPADTTFNHPKGVYCEEGHYFFPVGALDTFWRSVENIKSMSSFPWFAGPQGSGMLWASSQATPMRRVEVQNDLVLFQYTSGDAAGFASGGFVANTLVHGRVSSGSQQQYLSRNCQIGGWNDGVWNMVYVGTEGAPEAHCGANPSAQIRPYVVVEATPVIAEKPFITIDTKGKFFLQRPRAQLNTRGIDHTLDNADEIDFSQVFVASANLTAAVINQKLAEGRHVVLAPGIYELDEPLLLQKDGQVLLGLGMATLISAAGNAVVQVLDGVDGVRVAGLILQAGPKPTSVLLAWGTGGPGGTGGSGGSGGYAGQASDPGFLHDVFARVGGSSLAPVQAKVMIAIHSGNVVGDNLWLWRADHSIGGGAIANRSNPCEHGIVVAGNDVTMYSLAAEHTLNDVVSWSGENGRSFMVQVELPYDVTQADWGDQGYVGYRVAEGVTKHEAHGVGVYHYFRDYNVTSKSGIVCPPALESSFISPLSVYLNGGGTVNHVINGNGNATGPSEPDSSPGAHTEWFCA